MKEVVFLSGKGGTGKTSLIAAVALNLFRRGEKVVVSDCDVDASNLHLVLGRKNEKREKISVIEKAEIDPEKCISCGRCYEACAFHAVKKEPYIIDSYTCEGCGACELACPADAIKMRWIENASVIEGETRYGFPIISGELDVGESGSGKIVDEVKSRARKKAEEKDADLLLVDGAAGIGCPVIASIKGADFAFVIAEPTPSSLADAERAVELLNHFRCDYAVVINKKDINSEYRKKIEEKYGKKVVCSIPYSDEFFESAKKGIPINERKEFVEIIERLSRAVLSGHHSI